MHVQHLAGEVAVRPLAVLRDELHLAGYADDAGQVFEVEGTRVAAGQLPPVAS